MENLLNTSVDILQQRCKQFDSVNVEDLMTVATCIQQIYSAVIDVRALTTVEAHVLQTERLNLTQFAAVQGVAPSGLRRRYSENLASILKNVADGGQLDERALLNELRSFDVHTIRQVTDNPSVDPVGNSCTAQSMEPPSLRTVLSDPMVKISERVDESERKRITNAYALLGRIYETLRGALNDADDLDTWVAAGGSSVSLQWSKSLRIDQVLPILLPLERDEVPIGGISELRLFNVQLDVADLAWSEGKRSLSVRLIRRN